MTLAEITRRLDRYLGGESARDFYTAQVRLDAINDAQRQVAWDLNIPRRYANVTGASPLTLDTESRGGGLISIKAVNDDGSVYVLPLRTVAEAEQRDKYWSEEETTSSEPARYAIYDPANLSAPIYIVPPHSDTRLYRVEYFVEPSDFTLAQLDEGTAVPFDGDSDFTPAHSLIPLLAAALLWDMQKDDDGLKWYSRYMREYEAKKNDYYSDINSSWLIAENPFFRSFRR